MAGSRVVKQGRCPVADYDDCNWLPDSAEKKEALLQKLRRELVAIDQFSSLRIFLVLCLFSPCFLW